MTSYCYTGCDGSAEPQANILEVPAAFNEGQVWIIGVKSVGIIKGFRFKIVYPCQRKMTTY